MSSSFISSHENWISPDLVADFPKIPLLCCIQYAAAKRLLIVYVNLSVEGDEIFDSFSSFVPLLNGCFIASALVSSASQVFSVHISYHVPFDSVHPGEPGLSLAFPDILLVTCELLKGRIVKTFPPMSSPAHSRYFVKEDPCSKYFVVRKVETEAADGQGRVCLLKDS